MTTDADHDHAFELWATFHRAPAGAPPAHTSFVVFTCACGVYKIFPAINFAICTEAFQAQFRAAAAAAGWHEALVSASRERGESAVSLLWILVVIVGVFALLLLGLWLIGPIPLG